MLNIIIYKLEDEMCFYQLPFKKPVNETQVSHIFNKLLTILQYYIKTPPGPLIAYR